MYLFIRYLLISQIERSEWPGNGGGYNAEIGHGPGAGRQLRLGRRRGPPAGHMYRMIE